MSAIGFRVFVINWKPVSRCCIIYVHSYLSFLPLVSTIFSVSKFPFSFLLLPSVILQQEKNLFLFLQEHIYFSILGTRIGCLFALKYVWAQCAIWWTYHNFTYVTQYYFMALLIQSILDNEFKARVIKRVNKIYIYTNHFLQIMRYP